MKNKINTFYKVFFLIIISFFSSCNDKNKNQDMAINNTKKDISVSINLTVSEGKRLIAKGIAKYLKDNGHLDSGMVIISRGSTNTYIAEEIVGLNLPRGSFLTGHFVPVGEKPVNNTGHDIGEIVIINGKVENIKYADAVKNLREGDIILKGGNIMNYSQKTAAVCIGAPDGGTTYKFLPYIGKEKAQLIIPIGLEKDTSFDISTAKKELDTTKEKKNFIPKLHIFEDGLIFSEIEALKVFADINAIPYGIGGIKGREGGITLLVNGSKGAIDTIEELINSIQGEKEFI